MATGRVVGVLQRNLRDYVVSIPEEEINSRSSRVSYLQLTVKFDLKETKFFQGFELRRVFCKTEGTIVLIRVKEGCV